MHIKHQQKSKYLDLDQVRFIHIAETPKRISKQKRKKTRKTHRVEHEEEEEEEERKMTRQFLWREETHVEAERRRRSTTASTDL